MTAKQTVLYTFHKVREQCEQANPDAWRAFLDFYAPLCLQLLAIYLPDDPPEERDASLRVVENTLAALVENNCERFRATDRQSERDFLVGIRELLLETAASHDAAAAAMQQANRALTFEALAKLAEGLPLAHQEMLFFKLAGYTDADPRACHAHLADDRADSV